MFNWKDEYSVNIKAIDDQHKKLFEIGEKIYDLSKLDEKYDHYDEIIKVLDELIDYTEYHFKFEEELFEKFGFEEAETHKFEHMFFVKKIGKIGRKDIDKEQVETALEIAKFIADWITGHILKTDMKYKQHLNANGLY